MVPRTGRLPSTLWKLPSFLNAVILPTGKRNTQLVRGPKPSRGSSQGAAAHLGLLICNAVWGQDLSG